MTTAARWPASSLPEKSHDFLPTAQGRIWFSQWLLATGTLPSRRLALSAAQWFRLWSIAPNNAATGGQTLALELQPDVHILQQRF